MAVCRIVADDRIPFLKGVLESAGAEVIYMPGAAISNRDLAGADALIVRTRTKCSRDLLEGTGVCAVATATIGTDHIDTDYLAKQGIAFASAKGCNAVSVACYIASVLVHYDRPFCGRVLGIVGAGAVGSVVKQYGEALGYRVITCDPPRKKIFPREKHLPLYEVLAEADVVTLHVPLAVTGEYATYHMANQKFFAAMRTGSLFINAARGEVVDENALLNSLAAGKPARTVIDVWEHEPEINTRLLDAATLATSHIAGYSRDGKANGTVMSVRFISGVLGLGLDDWRHPELPPPPEPVIDVGGRSAAECIAEVTDRVYDFRRDDMALRRAHEDFEKIRGEYPCRRDFSGCRIINYAPDEKNFWQKAGFTI